MFWEYEGIRISYEQSGQGPDLLLLHGWGCSHTIFDAFVPALAATHRVTGIDFPGFGDSDEPSEVWGVFEYEKMLEAFCDALGIVSPQIIAHSFGGRIAIIFASRRTTGRLVFTDAAGIKPRRSLKYYVKVYSFKLSKLFLSREAIEKRRASAGSSDYRNASPRMRAILSRTVNQDLSHLLCDIKAPVLLFWGENDTATPMRDARKMEKLIPDAAIVSVPGGSHFSFLDAPGLFAGVLDSFLAV